MINFGIAIAACLVFLKVFVLVYERNLLFFPSRDFGVRPEDASLRAEDWNLTAADGVKFHAWWFPCDSAARAVLVCHGNGGNISHRLHLAKGYTQAGYAVCLFDYRGYGKSEGSPTVEGCLLDAEAALEAMAAAGYRAESVIVHGESLGGAIATKLVSAHRECPGLVLDGTFTSVKDMAHEIVPFLPLHVFVTLDMNTIGLLRDLKTPVIIFHGEKDLQIPFEMARRNYEAAAGRKKFVPVADGGHCDLTIPLGMKYFEMVKEFMEGA